MIYLVTIFLIFIDLFTKKLAQIYLMQKYNLLGDFLYLKYIENNGIAFSIQITGMFLKLITIILIFVIGYYYFTEERKKKNIFVDLAFAFIFGGAIGNGYERIFNGKVIDFIGVSYFSIFNLADVFITVGVLIYITYFILYNKNNNEIG